MTNGNGNGNGNENGSDAPPETQRRPFAFRSLDLTNPEIQAQAILQLAEHAEETVRVHVEHKRELGKVRQVVEQSSRIVEQSAEEQGKIFAELMRMSRKQDLTHALVQSTAFKVGRNVEITEAHREKIREHDRTIIAIRDRNDRIDAEEAAKHAKLMSDVEHLKHDVAELEDDVEDTQNRHLDGIQKIATSLVGEVARAKLTSVTDEARESRVDMREFGKEHREEKRDTKKWVLGLVGAVVVLVAGGLVTAYLGKPATPGTPIAPSAEHK